MSIYDHFRREEHAFIDQVMEWRNQVESQYAQRRTDFLDPREQDIVRSIIGKTSSSQVAFFGGHPATERKRSLIYPDYYQPEHADFGVDLLVVKYPSKFVTILHKDVLGSLMSLGVKRAKFGDILVHDGMVQMIVAEEISSYVRANLTTIGRATVTVEMAGLDRLSIVEEEWTSLSGTVSSLRLDVVISEFYHLSRQKAVTLVKNGLVKVNWKIVDQPSYEVKTGDHLSVRGFGRSKLEIIEGKTKKDKWRIDYSILQ